MDSFFGGREGCYWQESCTSGHGLMHVKALFVIVWFPHMCHDSNLVSSFFFSQMYCLNMIKPHCHVLIKKCRGQIDGSLVKSTCCIAEALDIFPTPIWWLTDIYNSSPIPTGIRHTCGIFDAGKTLIHKVFYL